MILGDLTDAKDYHPAGLTNRLVEAITVITWLGVDVYILQGNHDYLRKGHSYFDFLNHIPRVRFISTMTDDGQAKGDGPLAFFLPHTREPAKDWAGFDFSHYSYLFMHQTISGAVASNGQEMEGEEMPDFRVKGGPKVYSGDIHVPQVIKGVEYVGSPYHVHFGDAFKPRCVLLDRRNRPVDLHFKTISRLALKASTLRQVQNFDLKAGDQVKLTFELDPGDAHAWSRLKREASAILADRGVEIHGLKLAIQRSERRLGATQGGRPTRLRLSDPDAILRFVEREDLGGRLGLDGAGGGVEVVDFSSAGAGGGEFGGELAISTPGSTHGHNSAAKAFNSAGLTSGDITAPQTGTSPTAVGQVDNGSFIESVATYPNKTFNGNFYFIGPVFVAS